MPIVNVQRRVDGNLVYGSVNEVTNEQNGETKPPQFGVPGAVAAPSDALLESIGSLEVCRDFYNDRDFYNLSIKVYKAYFMILAKSSCRYFCRLKIN